MRLSTRLSALAFVPFLLAGCGIGPGALRTLAWIDAPIEGLNIPFGEIVNLEGHASSSKGLSRIEFLVNGERIVEQDSLSMVGMLAHFEHIWLPESPGEYTLDLIAYGGDDSESGHDSVTIYIVDDSEEDIRATTTPTVSVTKTEEIATPTVTLTREYTPTSTRTPPPDETGPPAPTPISPIGGVMTGCSFSGLLEWHSVNDPSGVAEYRVELQSHTGDENWQVVSGSPWTGISATSQDITQYCGRYYRWRVRARDGAGNWGAYSSWATFAVALE